jgi:pyruvate kinase
MDANTKIRRKAKIVATIGPASQTEQVLERLVSAGINVVRLNFSHGSHTEHATVIATVRSVSKRLGIPVAILQDLQGTKIRVGALAKPLTLTPATNVILYREGAAEPSPLHGEPLIPVDFPQLFGAVGPGSRILLDDGRLALTVKSVAGEVVVAQVDTGGLLSAHKGTNLPGARLPIPSFTEKDSQDLQFGLEQGVDFVAISFVRTAHDVQQVKDAVTTRRPTDRPLLIAKLERPEALQNIDAILETADGVMVARGDLGVEMSPEEVPEAQKRIIKLANRAGKLVITATQMLESMIHTPLPTRAEASDVANAVFDGTDAVMLSAETAAGEYPVESVTLMDRIVRRAEADFTTWGHGQVIESQGQHDDAVALANAARELAHDREVAAIAVFTRTGRSAVFMSKARPRVPILAVTPQERTYRRLPLLWGVTPWIVPMADTVEEMIEGIEAALKESGIVQAGRQVILVGGYPLSEIRPPNMAILHTVR